MNPDQLAASQVHFAELQMYITAAAIFLGPLSGVIFTLWFQKRKERRDAKLQLFMVLVGERKRVPSQQATQALNRIDVVFFDSPKIKNLWHEYYELLHSAPGELRVHKWLELLSAMAVELGYSGLSQIELDKFYTPQGHVDAEEFQRKVGEQWGRVLENTEFFLVQPRVVENKNTNN